MAWLVIVNILLTAQKILMGMNS